MAKWFNPVCIVFWVIATIVATLAGISFKEALVIYGMMSMAMCTAGWAAFYGLKFLIKAFPSKFDFVLFRVVAIIIISLTAYSIMMQLLEWILGTQV